MTPFQTIGGEAALRRIIDRFVDRCFDDVMIGFFFRQASRTRIKEFEYQHAAASLGAEIAYEGRPLDRAHARHPIMGGQFARRLQILREVLEEANVPEPIRAAWLAHQESFRAQITADPDSNCNADRAFERTRRS